MARTAQRRRESSLSRRQDIINQHWEVRSWAHRDVYGTTTDGVSVYRDGWLIAEGPLKGAPYRRATRTIPKLPGLPEDARKRFSGRRR